MTADRVQAVAIGTGAAVATGLVWFGLSIATGLIFHLMPAGPAIAAVVAHAWRAGDDPIPRGHLTLLLAVAFVVTAGTAIAVESTGGSLDDLPVIVAAYLGGVVVAVRLAVRHRTRAQIDRRPPAPEATARGQGEDA